MSKKTFKSTMSSIGNGLALTAAAMNNAPIRTRMSEIDEEIKKLQEERAKLENQLVSYK